MAASGVGLGNGVGVGAGVNSREPVRRAMVWTGPPLEVASCTLGDGLRLRSGVGCCGGSFVFNMGRVQVGLS